MGDDGTVRRWCLATHSLLQVAQLRAPARAVAYSKDGTLLAVGLGADPKRSAEASASSPPSFRNKKSGRFVILSAADLGEVVHRGEAAPADKELCARAAPSRTVQWQLLTRPCLCLRPPTAGLLLSVSTGPAHC